MEILLSTLATNQLDRVYTDRSIYGAYGRFTPWFIRWNYVFHQYVRESVLSTLTHSHGVFAIGRIGSLEYFIYYVAGIKYFAIERFSFPTFRFTSRTTPSVEVSKSPRYWPKPTKTTFTLPPKTRVLNGTYYDGLKIGYHNHKYIILKSDGQPLVEKWFDKKPRIFNEPFGKYNIIAHVSYSKSLFAVSLDGRFYDMHRLWDDAYLNEAFLLMLDNLINEVFTSYKRRTLLESRNNVIRLNETQLCGIVKRIINKLIA